ncbi:MAG: saccharopine dehydrogenase NADP-binding domain-containing protein [Kofleriaceae bacterium]
MSSRDDGLIVVLGARGVVGRRICDALAAAGVPYAIGVRRAVLDPGTESPALDAGRGAPIRTEVCDAFDAASLARAFADARVVVNAAGPLRETAAPVLVAAMAAGAHYLDVGGEQAVMHALYERHESTVRRAGLVALPGAGLDCMIGDLAAAWAAQHLAEEPDEGPPVRDTPAPRIAELAPLDEIATSHVYDDLALSAGSQRALFGAIGHRPLVWCRDRWEPGRVGQTRRVNVGPALGGEREAIAYAGGEAISIPHHVATQLVTTYASLSRRATGLARLVAHALPLVPRAAAGLLAPYAPPGDDLTRTRFAIVAQVRRGFSTTQISLRGHDLYRTTAIVTAWAARQLAARGAGPVGMRAPGELFRAAPALRELAREADLALEPSFVDAG